MVQNVIKIGNSLGITLPMEFVVKHKIKPGRKIAVTLSPITKSTKYELTTDEEFLELIKEVESRYNGALGELARLQ